MSGAVLSPRVERIVALGVAGIVLLAVAVAAVVQSPVPAAAANCDGGIVTGGVQVGCGNNGTNPPRPDVPGGSTQIWVDPLEYRYVVNCSVNGPNNPDDALCTGAIAACDDGEIQFRVYTRERGSDDPWRGGALLCRGADDPDPNRPLTVNDVYDEVVELAPLPTITVEPATKTYVNVPTNVSTEDGSFGPFTAELDELPISISVTFTANGFRWNFGDGGTAQGAGVAGAQVGQAGAVEHLYRRSGTYQITLERTYAAAVTVGGQTIDIQAPITNTSAPYALQVGELQSVVTEVD